MGRISRRTNWYFWGLILGLLFTVLAYVLIVAGLQSATSPYRFIDLLLPRLADVVVAAWLFWVGSSIGSFLNVVAWRMPRGESINGFSHCPRCNHRLSARDNWPVFGWIMLRGRCRTCRLPISPRYPLVELFVGVTILVVGYIELYLGQWNLPNPERVYHESGPMGMPHLTRQAMGVGLYHVVVIACSWALGLVRFDQQKLPRSLSRFVLFFTIGPMLFWPPVMQVYWQATVPNDWPSWSFLDAVMRVIAAVVAAALIARSMARYVCPTADLKLDPMGQGTKRLIDLVLMLIVPAVVVGWQAILGVVIFASLLGACLRRTSEARTDGLSWFAVSLPVALALQLSLWRPLESLVYWPSSQSPPWVIIVAAIACLIVPAVLRNPVSTPENPVGAQGDDLQKGGAAWDDEEDESDEEDDQCDLRDIHRDEILHGEKDESGESTTERPDKDPGLNPRSEESG